MPHEGQVADSRRARRLARRIDDVLRKRTQYQYEQEALLHKHEFLLESAEALTAALATSSEPAATSSQTREVSTLRLQYRDDIEAIRSQHATIKTLQSSLSTLENRLQAKEKEVVEVLKALGGQLTADGADGADDESLRSNPAAPPVSDTPSVLRRYWDRKGDERIQHERLQELEQYYAEGVAQRELVEDRGDSMPISHEQFEHDYLTQREQILSDLSSAEEDVAELIAQCIASGISTEVKRSPTGDMVASSVGSTIYDYIGSPFVRGDLLSTNITAPLFGQSSDLDRHQDNIQGWLDNVSVLTVEPHGTAFSDGDDPTAIGSLSEAVSEHSYLSSSPIPSARTLATLGTDANPAREE